MTWNPDLSYGNRSTHFGGQDYFQGLKKIWDAGGDNRQKNLRDYRTKVLDWMGQAGNLDKIHESNRLGAGSGMGHDIASGDLTWNFVGSGGALSAERFGGADMMAARAAGHSFKDIQKYMDEHSDKLFGRNPKGMGGLYDQVATEARFEDQKSNWTEAVGGLKESFDTGMQEHTEQLGSKFEAGMGGVSDAITAQTQAEERYRADQQNWQRRQENMQQMMIQEGRRQSREKPVMAVMPGATSYGGGGGGASAFARKKKQTTGLNIA